MHDKSRSRDLKSSVVECLRGSCGPILTSRDGTSFLYASLEESPEGFVTGVLDHVPAKGLMFCTNNFENCGVNETTARARLGEIYRVIAQGLDCARSLPNFSSNDSSVAAFLWVLAVIVGTPVAGARL